MEHVKIGQVLSVDEDFTITTDDTDEAINIRKGDMGIVDSQGSVKYIIGEAITKKHVVYEPEQLTGYNVVELVNLIVNNLESELDVTIEDLVKGTDKTEGDFILSIADSLGFVLVD